VASGRSSKTDELPPDNAARIVIFDALAVDGSTAIQEASLFERVIPRLRQLVPRELHINGERPYVEAKIAACVEAGILQRDPGDSGLLRLGGTSPRVRFPDGVTRDYPAGLEQARERLDADEVRLRGAKFDPRKNVGSIADDRSSADYQRLVDSIKEHGFLRSKKIHVNRWDEIVDGRARLAAASDLGIEVDREPIERHRDTALQNAMLVLHLNAGRVSDEQRLTMHQAIEGATSRTWAAIEADLILTRAWRVAKPKRYHASLGVTLHSFRPGDPPKVQVTTDGSRVQLRSLTDEAGLKPWTHKDLEDQVSFEEGYSPGSGPRANFVSIMQLIDGIDRMQASRRQARRLKVHPEWDVIREWLVAFTAGASATADEPPTTSGEEGSPSSG